MKIEKRELRLKQTIVCVVEFRLEMTHKSYIDYSTSYNCYRLYDFEHIIPLVF